MPTDKAEPAAQPAAEPDERAAFEVWALSDDGGWWPEAVRRVGEGYHAGAVTKQWKGWQARAMKATPAAEPDAQDAKRYRWVKEHPDAFGWNYAIDPAEMERAIDSAMKAKP